MGSEWTMAETITLRAYLDELGRMLEQEAPTEVISHCRYILQHFPQNVETYRLLGKALLQKGHQENLDEYFTEAAEVFRRVLAAVPNDYVAHLGLSETYDRNEQLDQAIWHLERAYEQMPGNVALQDALRELYIKRDGEEQAPARIQLTRGALARQYMNGQLYDQAAAELQAALAQHPERVDLQVMLAEALWSGWHEVEAGETAVRVLKRLPNCLAANRILAQLWLDNERPTDARPFLDRVEALDPYAAAYLLQPGVENADYVELERLDYYRQSQAELSAQTPGWVHELDVELNAGDLWAAPPPAAKPAEKAAAPGPDRIDMASLFGVPSEAGQEDIGEPEDWQTETPPDWFAEPGPAQRVAQGDEVTAPAVFAEMDMGEADGAAIEADWLFEAEEVEETEESALAEDGVPEASAPTQQGEEPPGEPDVWEELRAAAGEEGELTLPEAILPAEDSSRDEGDSGDIFAALGILDAEWETAASDEAFPSASGEVGQQPVGFPFEWDGEPATPAEAGAGEQPLAQGEEVPGGMLPQVTAAADASFIDHLAETPDFEQLGVDDLDWSVFQEALEAEEPGTPEGEIAAPAPPVAEGTQFITSDELRFLDELPPAGGEAETVENERLRDEIDAAFQDFLSFDERSLDEPKETEAISAPEWLPAWDTNAVGEEGDVSAREPEVAESGEPVGKPRLDDTLVSESVPMAEAPSGEEEGDQVELGDAMAWLKDSLSAEDVADADFLAAVAAAGEADFAPADEEVAQPATDLPAWIQEAAPLSERATGTDEETLTPEEEQAFETGESEGKVAEQEAALLAEWETWEAAQETAALAGEGGEPPGSEAGTADWLSSFAYEEHEPPPEEMPFAEAEDETTPLDEAVAPEAASLASAESQGMAGQTELEAGETGEGAADEVSPSWLEGLAGLEEGEIPAENALDDLAALLTQPYDPFEGGSPDKVPHYASARDTGILQPDEQPDWMAAFTGEEVAPELDEEVDALLAGEPEPADRQAMSGARGMESDVRAGDFVPDADSGDERGEPLPAQEADFPFDLDVPAEEGEIPSWLLAIADSEAHKLDEEFADEGIPEIQESALDVQDLIEADLAAPEPSEVAAEVEVADEWDVGEESLPGVAEAEMAWAESEDSAFGKEAVAAEADWSYPVTADGATELTGALLEEYDDEPVPEDFSFGDWLPIWLRKPLEGGLDGSLGISRDEVSEPPEWLRDVNEDEQ